MKSKIKTIIDSIPIPALPFVSIASLLVMGFVFYSVFVSPPYRRYKSLSKHYQSSIEDLKTYNHLLTAPDPRKSVDPRTAQLLEALQPDIGSYTNVINYQLIEHHGIDKIKFSSINLGHEAKLTPKESEIASPFQKMVLEMTLTGTYESLGRYLSLLPSIPYPYNIDSLNIEPCPGALPLQMSLKLTFYLVSS